MIETTGRTPTDLGGGMYVKQDPNERPRFYVNVENIDDHTRRFKEAGGTIIVEKQEIPGFGWSVLGTDPEGNFLGMFQPLSPPPRPRAVSRNKSRSKKGSSSKKSRKRKR
jgi:predicted enzyme related to lactoylglutathione lyase